MSEKSPAGAAIPGLAFSGRAEWALLGPALEETVVESSNTRREVDTEDESKSQNANSSLDF